MGGWHGVSSKKPKQFYRMWKKTLDRTCLFRLPFHIRISTFTLLMLTLGQVAYEERSQKGIILSMPGTYVTLIKNHLYLPCAFFLCLLRNAIESARSLVRRMRREKQAIAANYRNISSKEIRLIIWKPFSFTLTKSNISNAFRFENQRESPFFGQHRRALVYFAHPQSRRFHMLKVHFQGQKKSNENRLSNTTVDLLVAPWQKPDINYRRTKPSAKRCSRQCGAECF